MNAHIHMMTMYSDDDNDDDENSNNNGFRYCNKGGNFFEGGGDGLITSTPVVH